VTPSKAERAHLCGFTVDSGGHFTILIK
jgi:hypothetical protein